MMRLLLILLVPALMLADIQPSEDGTVEELEPAPTVVMEQDQSVVLFGTVKVWFDGPNIAGDECLLHVDLVEVAVPVGTAKKIVVKEEGEEVSFTITCNSHE